MPVAPASMLCTKRSARHADEAELAAVAQIAA